MPSAANSFVLTSPGVYYLEDDGIPFNNRSRLRRPDGTFTEIDHSAGTINVSTNGSAGIVLYVNLVDPLRSGGLFVGHETNASWAPESIVVQHIETNGRATLTATGSVTEAGDSDAEADIVASQLLISAGTGIGTPANALETQVAVIEAETGTGGLNIANFGALSDPFPQYVQIGGLTDALHGLKVRTSGDLTFVNEGSITLREWDLDPGTYEPFHTAVTGGSVSGNVTLIANGLDSDITNEADSWSVSTPVGDINLTAGRDIVLGRLGNPEHDVRSGHSLAINAGRDFTIDGRVVIVSNDSPSITGTVAITAGRSINILSTTDDNAIIGGQAGGSVTLTTGVLRMTRPGQALVGGNVVVNADRMIIDPASGIFANDVTLTTRTPGRAILIGSTSDSATALELSDAELDRVAGNRVTIGGYSTGTVSVIAPISNQPFGGLPDLVIRSGTDINVLANISTGVFASETHTLRLEARDNVFQAGASSITTRNLTVTTDAPDDDPGVGGAVTLSGSVTVASIRLVGGGDDDTLNGNADNDTVRATILGSDLFGMGGNDVLQGSAVADTLDGGEGNDTLRGLGGNDTLIGATGADAMTGGIGDDVYFVDTQSDSLTELVGEGNDRVAASVSFGLVGGVSVETLETTNLAGTDPINLAGNGFSQTIVGNNGNNVLNSGGGNDHLIGAGGQDTLIGSSSASTMEGGAGNDTYFVMDGSDAVIELSGGGSDRIAASVSYTLAPGAEVETLEAAMIADTTALNFTGNVFQNLLIGNNGANMLDGKGGMDTLNGAGGADTFAFTTALAANNVDTILGFLSGTDKIGLDDAIFTAVAPGALTAGAFVVAASAQDADDRIIYNPATGALLYDPDGTGAAAAVQFATLAGSPSLAASDFILI